MAIPTTTTKDRTTLYYKHWGEGQPVVFSHGWPLSAEAWEEKLGAKLAKDRESNPLSPHLRLNKGEKDMGAERIPIIVINGSVRPGNFTSMASALAVDEFRRHPEVAVEVIDPAALHLPLPGMDGNSEGAKILQEKVKSAAGIVFATPEYHGSFSSVTKLVIENLGFPSMLAGKPVALLGVAAGSIGAIKSLEHLRGVISHVGGIVLPLPVSVANVQSVFGADGRSKDPAIEKLIRSLAVNLLEYLHSSVCPRLTLERILREGVPASVSDSHTSA